MKDRPAAADRFGVKVKRLMSVPGVNVIVAATFMAAVGDVRRFEDRRKRTAYLGLDPRVRQSAPGPPRTAPSPSKAPTAPATRSTRRAGRSSASPARSPRSISASRRAAAPRSRSSPPRASSACLFWCLLARGEDYAFGQPSLTKKKMRRLQLQAGAQPFRGGRGVWSTNEAMREAERELALQAQRAYQRTAKDRQHNTKGASATPGRASHGSSSEHVARQTTGPRSAL